MIVRPKSPFRGIPLTQDRLKHLVIYNPENGEFRHRLDRERYKAGSVCGNLHSNGYWKIGIDGAYYYGHRLAWLYVHGWIPKEIDHINGKPADNRLANLRPATRSQNMANREAPKSGSGFKGVYKKGNMFVAHIKRDGTKRHLGYFKTPEEAHAAHMEAAQILHGEYLRDAA